MGMRGRRWAECEECGAQVRARPKRYIDVLREKELRKHACPYHGVSGLHFDPRPRDEGGWGWYCAVAFCESRYGGKPVPQ